MSDHKQVLIGSIVGVFFALLFLWWGFGSMSHPTDLNPGNSVVYALRWDFFIAVWMVILVMAVSLRRFGTSRYLDGTPPPEDHAIDIDRRVLNNTLEQAFIAIIAHLVLSTALPSSSLGIIPLLVVLFSVGRVSFWIGYHVVDKYPFLKAFGHSVTFFPTVFVYGYLFYRMSKIGL